MMTLANKRFQLTANSNVKDLGSNTILTVGQNGDLLFGKYEGGKVLRGNFIAKLKDNGSFQRLFHHYNEEGNLIMGQSSGTVETLDDGRMRIRELWQSNYDKGDAIYDELLGKEPSSESQSDYYFQLSMNK